MSISKNFENDIKVNQVSLEQVDEFDETERGSKGFGSTGLD